MGSIYLPPWRIDVTARSAVKPPLSMAELARVAARALTTATAPAPASLAIILSDDRELADLNTRHMGHDGATDVLSFPMMPPAAFPERIGQGPTAPSQPAPPFALPKGMRPHLGDVVVSVERATAQALEQGWSAAEELRQLVVHGILHICGWDHALPAERDAMRVMESAVLNAP